MINLKTMLKGTAPEVGRDELLKYTISNNVMEISGINDKIKGAIQINTNTNEVDGVIQVPFGDSENCITSDSFVSEIITNTAIVTAFKLCDDIKARCDVISPMKYELKIGDVQGSSMFMFCQLFDLFDNIISFYSDKSIQQNKNISNLSKFVFVLGCLFDSSMKNKYNIIVSDLRINDSTIMNGMMSSQRLAGNDSFVQIESLSSISFENCEIDINLKNSKIFAPGTVIYTKNCKILNYPFGDKE